MTKKTTFLLGLMLIPLMGHAEENLNQKVKQHEKEISELKQQIQQLKQAQSRPTTKSGGLKSTNFRGGASNNTTTPPGSILQQDQQPQISPAMRKELMKQLNGYKKHKKAEQKLLEELMKDEQ